MRIKRLKKQYNRDFSEEIIEEVNTVGTYKEGAVTYLHVDSELFDTQENTDTLYEQLWTQGYADLREYKVVEKCFGY